MTVKIYVARDIEGREWPPNTSHEAKACEWMLQKAWMEFQHLQELFVIIVNLQEPSADMVIIREIGLGVVEMKNHFGDIIFDQDGIWWAGRKAIHSGIHLNPREQVRIYATKIREKIIREILPARQQINKKHWNDHKFQTAVCFTNPRAKLGKIQKYFEERLPDKDDWEGKFSVFDPDSFTQWIRDLRFELEKAPPRDFSPFRLKPDVIEKIVTKSLNAVVWEEMMAAMPDGIPYGHLVLEDVTGREVFNLTKDHSTIGRSHQCDIVIPSRYGRVSKQHLAIDRDMKGITVKDLSSMNGTFLNNHPLEKPQRLINGSVLFLGGLSAEKKACKLTFELHGEIPEETATEQGTQVFEKYAKKQQRSQ